MSEVATKEVPIEELSQEEFKAARAKGQTTAEKPAKAESEESKPEEKVKAKGGFQTRIDRLIRLLVEQKIEAAEIRTREVGALGEQRLEVVTRGHPAERESDGYDQQPPEV